MKKLFILLVLGAISINGLSQDDSRSSVYGTCVEEADSSLTIYKCPNPRNVNEQNIQAIRDRLLSYYSSDLKAIDLAESGKSLIISFDIETRPSVIDEALSHFNLKIK